MKGWSAETADSFLETGLVPGPVTYSVLLPDPDVQAFHEYMEEAKKEAGAVD